MLGPLDLFPKSEASVDNSRLGLNFGTVHDVSVSSCLLDFFSQAQASPTEHDDQETGSTALRAR